MEAITGILLCLGTVFIVIASLGVLRMPDLYTRMHAATKAGTVGVSCLLLALAFSIPEITVISRVIGTILFIVLTAPVATHLLGRAMIKTGYKIWRND
ncbi:MULTISPECIES: monovalent cation/H(+) antiporter subunit G [Vibrio]|uniref:Monovalent cation/H(+) antiporter subunit G n=1 Tax=Vibrio ostreae TaxID=2841925 RepID=A0A975UDQ6_9VIBR|nr:MULTISPECIES: monovalent cation/H(+) antiporter subunit G [Vibrio]QXO18584.1 monovalent cation/H(+) antiporter subunit G [Vibrio ostreae]WGY47117.1 monovalent cation/H(+) antiporter subunit G [Vibrio sp. ABG19]